MDPLLARLVELARRARQPAPALVAGAAVIVQSVRRNFEAEGRPERWAPLARSTVRQRGSAHPILVRTGRMRRATRATRPSGRTIRVINDVPYARYHHTGTARMPQRRFLMVQSEDVPVIGEIFERYLFR
ncbi:MAG: phage virion morphogenesis protein [Chloroflexi bacterium]|nr:phage virion morphogenesis protein [Chloroflexota bacterium]